MPLVSWLVAGVVILVLLGFACRALLNNPRADVETGLIWGITRLYSRLVHRLRVRGLENLPPGRHVGPLIVVANHSAGVDPVLIQAGCPFEIRWMMAADMRHPLGEPIWRWNRVIFVARTGRDIAGVRDAIRHLKHGGVLGVFPEGGIARPRGTVLPFQPGIGLLIQHTGARVLPVVIDGTPDVSPAWASLVRSSRARVTFKPIIDYSRSGVPPERIAEDLRRRFIEWTGWHASDESPWLAAQRPA